MAGNANLLWAYNFQTEDYDALQAFGFVLDTTTTYFNTAYGVDPYVRTYPGALKPRRSLAFLNTNLTMRLPAEAITALNNGVATVGTVCWSYLVNTAAPPTTDSARYLFRVQGTGSTNENADLRGNTTYTSVTLFMDGIFKATSSAFDLTTWNWFAFAYDFSTATAKAKLRVNEVEVIAEQSEPWTIQTSVMDVSFRAAAAGAVPNSIFISEIVCFDTYTALTPIMYVDRYDPTADVGEVGTFTPSSGSFDYAVVDSPFDDGATSTVNSDASADDYVEVNSASTIADQIGVSPTIHAVIGMLAATGSAANMTMRVSNNGTNFDTGSVIALDTTPKVSVSVSPDRPSDGAAWTGADTINMRGYVDS